MRKTLLAAAAVGALLTLSACEGGYGYYGASADSNDVYYDGFYGPYHEGYWGPDAYFYYRGDDGRFIRDDNRHFRRERFDESRSYRSRPFDRDHDGR
jgi:hypothetical protein